MVIKHIVQKGDTLSQIAKKYKSSVGQIACLNNITNPDKLELGQTIRVLTNTSVGITNNIKGSIVDCRIILPRRLYFSIYYVADDNAFKRAADTQIKK